MTSCDQLIYVFKTTELQAIMLSIPYYHFIMSCDMSYDVILVMVYDVISCNVLMYCDEILMMSSKDIMRSPKQGYPLPHKKD